MFRRKKLGLDPVVDGVEHRQLYVCPSCGRKTTLDFDFTKCTICKISMCGGCRKRIELGYWDNRHFCSKHFNWVKDEINSLIELKREDKTED